MLPFPLTTSPRPGGAAPSDRRAHTLGHLRAALDLGCLSIASYRAAVPLPAWWGQGQSHGAHDGHRAGGADAPPRAADACCEQRGLPSAVRLVGGSRGSDLDRTSGLFVAERDFLRWLLYSNVSVCDLGAGTTTLLYKGVRAPRPSLPCPPPLRMSGGAATPVPTPSAATARNDADPPAPLPPAAAAAAVAELRERMGTAPSNPVGGALRANVHVCHGRRDDGKLAFMYSPIVRTLVEGFQAAGSSVAVRTVGAAANETAAFRAWARRLGARDTFIWLGPKQHGTPPWAEIRAAGAFAVYYQTEPISLAAGGGCMMPSARRPIPPSASLPTNFVDEIWEYSMANVLACRRHPRAPPLRHVPPGYVAPGYVALPASFATARASKAATLAAEAASTHALAGGDDRGRGNERAIFLGDLSLEERARCVGALRPLLRPINDVWDDGAMARLAGSARLVVNLHKRCMQSEQAQPAEATRLSQVLSAGGAVVSQRSHPQDEAAYAGLVSFAELRHLPTLVSQQLAAAAWTAANGSADAERARRAAAFRARFAPEKILARALARNAY